MKPTRYVDVAFYSRQRLIRECSPSWWDCFEPGDFKDVGLLLFVLTVILTLVAL